MGTKKKEKYSIPEIEGWYCARDVAKKLALSRQRIYQLVREGYLICVETRVGKLFLPEPIDKLSEAQEEVARLSEEVMRKHGR